MINYFKKLITILLTSWSLCLVSIVYPKLEVASFFTISNLQAQEAGEASSDAPENQVVTNGGAPTGKVKEVELKKSKSHLFSKMIHQLILIAVGLISFTFVTCAMATIFQWDLLIGGIAGVTYILGEVLSKFQTKAALEKLQVMELDNGNYDDSQKETFIRQAESYQKIAKTANIKYKLRLAAGVMYGISALWASLSWAGTIGSLGLKKLEDLRIISCLNAGVGPGIYIGGAVVAGFLAGFGAAIAILVLWATVFFKKLATTTAVELRAIVWTALMTFSALSAKAAKKEAATASKNAQKLQEIIAKMEKAQISTSFANVQDPRGGVQGAAGTAGKINLNTSPDKKGVISDTDFGQQVPCIDGSAPVDGKCKELTSELKKSDTFNILPKGLQSITAATTGFADSVSGSSNLSDGDIKNLDNIGGSFAAVERSIKGVQKKINKELVKQGKKPIDFEKRKAAKIAELKQVFRKSLLKSGKTNDQIAKAFKEGLGISISDNVVAKATPIEFNKSQGAISKVSLPSDAKPKKKNLDLSDLDFNMEDTKAIADKMGPRGTVDDEEGESTDDIVLNKEVSIFKVISLRYLRSGIPKLIKKKKLEPVNP